MDGADPVTKKRVLPQWMTEDKADTKKLSTGHSKRRKEISPRKHMVYCMDEKELVEYALEILNEGKARRDSKEKTASEIQEEEEEEPAADEVSEEEPQIPSEGTSSSLKIIPPLSKDLRSSTAAPASHSGEDDDPLKYVREIFFS